MIDVGNFDTDGNYLEHHPQEIIDDDMVIDNVEIFSGMFGL